MDAIEMLERQHREIEELFDDYERLGEGAMAAKKKIFRQLADDFAVHATIEEQIFYPAAKDERTEEQLREALEEHLSIKRICADLLSLDVADASFEAKVKVLQEQFEQHVESEEEELFPKVREALETDQLTDLADQMLQLAEELVEEGSPRENLPREIGEAAPLD